MAGNTPNRRDPSYRLHRASGQARVTLTDPVRPSRDFYLGPYGSEESRQRYYELLAEWRAAGCRLPEPEPAGDLTVAELVRRFSLHVRQTYCRPDGSLTGRGKKFRAATAELLRLFGQTPAAEFGPAKLKLLQRALVDAGLARTTINRDYMQCIRQVFRWGVQEELIPVQVWQAVQAVAPLRRGRTAARETEPVRPVPEAEIDAVRPFVARQVEALIDLQLLTGARADELTRLTLADLDTAGRVWFYRPAEHKGSHRGHERLILIGPRAQRIVQGFMEGRAVHEPLFSPREAQSERHAAASSHRAAPPASPDTERRVGDRYTTASYRRAIHRACDRAFPPPAELARIRVAGRGRHTSRWETPAEWRARLGATGRARLDQWRADHRWSPHRLRHNAATHLRQQFGIEVAQLVLGHRMGSQITELYTEANTKRAIEVIAEIG